MTKRRDPVLQIEYHTHTILTPASVPNPFATLVSEVFEYIV